MTALCSGVVFTISLLLSAASIPFSHTAWTRPRRRTKPMPLPILGMSDGQVSLFSKYAFAASEYFEYGAGGSTSRMLHNTNISAIHSVDSSLQWLDNINHPFWNGRLNTIYVDIGNTGKIGAPLNAKKKLNWPTYSSVIAGHRSADVVFVDGRFRVACICAALLYTAPGTIIMVHDWIRSRYHVVLEHAEVIDVADGFLAVLRAKPYMDRTALQSMYHEFKYSFQDQIRERSPGNTYDEWGIPFKVKGRKKRPRNH